MKYKKFNLVEISKSLIAFGKNFNKINSQLDIKREDFTREMVLNIVESYNFLNTLLEKNIDLFSAGGLYSLLELNHIVLCGTDPKKRFEYHTYIMETRKRFQENIKPILKWYKNEKEKAGPFKLAAAFYIQALSQPQLFIEGNHRTENVILNYILITFDKAPFIIGVDNALEYFNLSSKIKFSSKNSFITNLSEYPAIKDGLKELFNKYNDYKYIN